MKGKKVKCFNYKILVFDSPDINKKTEFKNSYYNTQNSFPKVSPNHPTLALYCYCLPSQLPKS